MSRIQESGSINSRYEYGTFLKTIPGLATFPPSIYVTVIESTYVFSKSTFCLEHVWIFWTQFVRPSLFIYIYIHILRRNDVTPRNVMRGVTNARKAELAREHVDVTLPKAFVRRAFERVGIDRVEPLGMTCLRGSLIRWPPSPQRAVTSITRLFTRRSAASTKKMPIRLDKRGKGKGVAHETVPTHRIPARSFISAHKRTISRAISQIGNPATIARTPKPSPILCSATCGPIVAAGCERTDSKPWQSCTPMF